VQVLDASHGSRIEDKLEVAFGPWKDAGETGLYSNPAFQAMPT
jgi:hypothetical protein